MKTKKATPQQKDAAPKNLPLNNTEIRAQQQRLLKALRERGSITTIDARHELNVMSPAPRVLELRAQGNRIYTEFVTVIDQYGYSHPRVARYVLIAEARGES